MRINPLGESALILRDLPLPAPVVAAQVSALPGVQEAWAAFDTVGVVLDGTAEFAYEPVIPGAIPEGRRHTIPVLYDGEDLAEVARRNGLTVEQVVELHARTYDVRAVGFCPGFAYLGPLPPEIDLPRRNTPRPRVDAGSVALAAGMTAVYPLERPGGWWIVGRTPLTLVDERDDFFPLRAGDRVRFVAVDREEYERLLGQRL